MPDTYQFGLAEPLASALNKCLKNLKYVSTCSLGLFCSPILSAQLLLCNSYICKLRRIDLHTAYNYMIASTLTLSYTGIEMMSRGKL